jgi:hypothetical protein
MFSYDPKDALRVAGKPQDAGFQEAPSYDFGDLNFDSAVARMRWEKAAAPGTKEATMDDLRSQLRGGAQHNWLAFFEAAFVRQTNADVVRGPEWANASMQNEERFENLMSKPRLLEA